MNTHSEFEIENIYEEIYPNTIEPRSSLAEDEIAQPQPKYEQMQVQMKKFNTELKDSQEELREKIKSLGNVSYGPETMNVQTQQLADQLGAERGNNAKLSADLAKSLELSLQLQLEIQGLKARAMQMQSEEKKYSQALFEKAKVLQRELELSRALKDETTMEFIKAKNAFATEQSLWEEKTQLFEIEIEKSNKDKNDLTQNIHNLNLLISEKDQKIESLNHEIEKISASFGEVESSAQQQNDVLKNLMDVAESKIIEMKMALDKKAVEAQDYYSHLQQALTQLGILKQENAALKEYMTKLNYYHQQTQQAQQQLVVTQLAQAQAQAKP